MHIAVAEFGGSDGSGQNGDRQWRVGAGQWRCGRKQNAKMEGRKVDGEVRVQCSLLGCSV